MGKLFHYLFFANYVISPSMISFFGDNRINHILTSFKEVVYNLKKKVDLDSFYFSDYHKHVSSQNKVVKTLQKFIVQGT